MTEFLLSIAVVLVAWQLYKTHEALGILDKYIKHMDNKISSAEGALWALDERISELEHTLKVKQDQMYEDLGSRLQELARQVHKDTK
jgi:chromosome segregation ATPase